MINRAQARAEESGGWRKLALVVMKRPLLVIIPILVGLAALATPFLGVSFGAIDVRMLPTDAPARVAAERVQQWFPGPDATASVVITGASATDPQAMKKYVNDLSRVPGVTQASTPPWCAPCWCQPPCGCWAGGTGGPRRACAWWRAVSHWPTDLWSTDAPSL